jgi:hypothetical protein
MMPGLGVDQLGTDLDPVTGAADTAFHDVMHPELASDPLHAHRLLAVGERGMARDHEHRPEPGKLGDDVVGDAVAEIGLRRVTAQVEEGQDGDRRLVG